MLSARKPIQPRRAGFERLESRELMAADLTSAYRSTAFLASVVGADHAVGATFITPAASGTSTVTPGASPKSTAAPAADWYTATLHDAALRSLVRQEATDNVLSRQDMLSIFSQVERDGRVTADEFGDLKQIVAKTSFFTSVTYVDALSADVVNGNPANGHYQGTTLGNLAAGSSAAQLEKLVDKWFLGLDHPTAMAGTTYKQVSGSLFPHAPVYNDVRQGLLGDCYYLASLAETALVSPGVINNMFIVNGDGTYTVRFNHAGKAEYVTVDSKLPVDSHGNYAYANFGLNSATKTTPLWVALAEKAYVQMNESRWLRTDAHDVGRNSYDAIEGGYMFEALNQITGLAGGYAAVNPTTFTAAYNAHVLITFGSYSNPVDSSVVGNHAYAVVSYNKSTQQVVLFNPWGINNGYAPGLVTLTWTQMTQDFFAMEYAA